MQRKLHEASATIDRVGVRRRAIERKLANVETLPEHEAGLLLGLDGGEAPALPDAAED